jgi:DNA-binding LytR/AlgR family response regulator
MTTHKKQNSASILFLEGDANYTNIHYKSGLKVTSAYTLIRHQELLNSFIRISKKYLVNPTHIKNYKKEGRFAQIQLDNGKNIPVSRRKVKEVEFSLAQKHCQ